MLIPTLSKIKEWRQSGRMRRRDEIFWAGDVKMYDAWLYIVEQRVEKWQKNKK